MKEDSYKKILLPMIKNVNPSSIAGDIVGVQPMTEPNKGNVKVTVSDEPRKFEFGDLVHFFIGSWKRYDGHEFITPHEYLARFGKPKIYV